MHIAKIKEFLFKIIHRICICKDTLYKWNLSNTSNCIYCNHEKQTLKHLLWECRDVNNFWNYIGDKLNIEFTYSKLIIGSEQISENNTTSILMYLIYKKFVSDINEKARIPLNTFLKTELTSTIELYKVVHHTSNLYEPLANVLKYI